MSKQNLSDNLNMLLKLTGDMSLSDLARETKIPQPTLHHIIEGKTKKPRRHALEALAKFFSISISQLTGAAPFTQSFFNSPNDKLCISTIPIIEWSQAKDWHRDLYKDINFDEIILKKKVDKNAFALQLNNSSMEPLFQEKSILIFDPGKYPKERDFILVYLKRMDSLIFNRLFIEGKNFYVKQDKESGDAELIKLSSDKDKIIGTLIETRLLF